MVRSRLTKSTFREIKSSFGRFMAILAIIGLGVGFFAGLKVAKQAMVSTVEDYLDAHEFYDYRLLSTMGFDQASVNYIRGQEGVAFAEGGLSFDAMYGLEPAEKAAPEPGAETATEGVIKTYSLPEKINAVELLSGRMPVSDDECVADANRFGEDDLGSKLVLTWENDEETLEHFTWEEYTIVGIVQSPLYLQYERGNTSLGSGRLDGFAYLPRDGFADEYFTEIYIKFEEEYGLYSDEYEEYIERTEELWESYAEETADIRYQDILADAQGELDDARRELADKRAEGEQELADAAATLADAEKELADGEQALEDAKRELAKGRRTLREKEAELEDARRTVAEKEIELADGERELAEGEESWERGLRDFAKAGEELNRQRDQLAAQKKLVQDGLAQIEGRLAGPREKLAGLEQMAEADPEDSDIRSQIDAIKAGMAPYVEQENELKSNLALIAQGESQLSAAQAEIRKADYALTEAGRELVASRKKIEDGRVALEDARAEIADGEQALEDAKRELADAQKELAEKELELIDAQTEYEDGLQEYLDAQDEFDKKIAEAEEKIADAQAELDDLDPPDTYLLGRDTNVGYVCFENDSGIVEGIANIFPVFFVLVAALVCITTMNRMVEEQRTQIGVLKAIGYGEGAVMSKYMVYSGLASVVGCVVGFCIGTWGFPKVIWAAYGIMYRAEDILYVFDWRLAVISLAVSLVCSVGTTWLSCRVELMQVAAQLMRPKAPKAGKRVFLEHFPFLWNRLSFLRKVSLRNIFRYKKRLFMMIVGISGCTALLVTGFGIKDSIAGIADKQFGEIQIFDLEAALHDAADKETLEDLDGMETDDIDSYLCVMEKNMDLAAQGGIKSVVLIAGAPDRMPEFVDLHTMEGEPISYPGRGEGVISSKLAEECGVEVGDSVVLRDEDMREIALIVTGIQENYIYHYMYISETTWEDHMGEEPERKTVYVNVARQADADVHGTAAALMQLDNVSNVTVNLDTRERVGSMMASLDIIVVTVILCAAGLAFIVLYNLTNINITERIREIATIKVLGFYKKETASYVFRENLILSAMGMVLGLVLGKLLHGLVMDEIRIDMIAFDIYVKPISYVYSGLLTIGFAWLVGKVMGGKLESISMTESLKSVD